MLDLLKSLTIKVKDIAYKLGLIADFVVEQGISDIWTYKKWNSGIAECWGSYMFPTSGGAVQLILPFNMANTAYVVLGTPAHNGSVVTRHGCYNASGNNANAVGSFYYNAILSSYYNVTMNFHVIGRWK